MVTAYGHRLLADIAESRVRRLAAVLDAMTPAQRAALAHGLLGFHQAHTSDRGHRDPQG
ncbi:hypothetical protein AB0G87_03255 [Streptomyces asoensis]|uniref:hypothetical protein n=1 Tax=Streptomyces asoensis TaxID=249586 RepID=UPI0033DCA03A